MSVSVYSPVASQTYVDELEADFKARFPPPGQAASEPVASAGAEAGAGDAPGEEFSWHEAEAPPAELTGGVAVKVGRVCCVCVCVCVRVSH